MSVAPNRSRGGLVARRADLSRVTPFTWAWQDRILAGYLNLLVGDEGAGKGTFTAWLVARLTRGELPGDLRGKPVRVLMVGDEDGFDNVTVPRLHEAGANLELVHDLGIERPDGSLVFDRDAREFRDFIADGGYKAVIFDQLLDHLGIGVDNWRDKQVREALAPLRRLAADLEIAPLATLHTNKATSGGFRQRQSGTQAFNAVSRSSLWLTKHPEDSELRVIVRGKGNYSAEPPGVEFGIESRHPLINGHRHSVGAAVSVRECDVRLDDVLAAGGGEPQTKSGTGRQIIRDELADGEWRPAGPIIERLVDEAELDDRRARDLARGLGVEKRNAKGFQAGMEWRLPRAEPQPDVAAPKAEPGGNAVVWDFTAGADVVDLDAKRGQA